MLSSSCAPICGINAPRPRPFGFAEANRVMRTRLKKKELPEHGAPILSFFLGRPFPGTQPLKGRGERKKKKTTVGTTHTE